MSDVRTVMRLTTICITMTANAVNRFFAKSAMPCFKSINGFGRPPSNIGVLIVNMLCTAGKSNRFARFTNAKTIHARPI